jgi:septum site-determining protein MinD
MIAVCDSLKSDFDFILIDSPAGIEHGFKTATAPADEVLIVTTPEVSAVRDADRIIGLTESAGKPAPHLIVNRLRPAMVKRGDMLDVSDVLEVLAIELIGIVPEDEMIITSTNRGQPVALDHKSPSGGAFTRIAGRVLGETIPFQVIGESTGIVERISRLLKK